MDTFDKRTGRSTVIRPPSSGYCPRLPVDIIMVGKPLPLNRTHVYELWQDDNNEALSWASAQGEVLPRWGFGNCAEAHAYYSRYTLAYATDVNFTMGIPVIARGESGVPDTALLKAAEIIAELVRQVDVRLAQQGIQGSRAALVGHRVRYAIFADSERRNDTCSLCKELDSTWDCNSHIDSRGGRDTSYHPEIPHCQEGGKYPTTISEQYGIPYLELDGSVRDSYCGCPTILHEFFHTVQDLVIFPMDAWGTLMIRLAAKRAVEEGIYVHHPGARDDGCDADFVNCVAMEFHVKAFLTWHGVLASPAEFRYQSRAEMKEEAPWIAALVHRYAEDGDWNPSSGARVDGPRDQTFPPHDTCARAPGSALCPGPLSAAFVGPPMTELMANADWAARSRLVPLESAPQAAGGAGASVLV